MIKKRKALVHNNYRTSTYFTVLYSIKYLFCNSDLFQGKNLSQYYDCCFVCLRFIASYEFVV